MAAFAPPVHCDGFLYSSFLYADAGNNNHHPRASVAELTALLRPEVAKAKRNKAPEIAQPTKDPPWHYWTAQLMHYGLTSTKDKNAAKVRLLSALNGNKLEVPGWVLRLEEKAKKEWEAENRKLKKAAKESEAPKPTKSKDVAATSKTSKTLTVKEIVSAEKTKAAANKVAGAKKAPTKEIATPKSTTAKRKRDETEQASPLEPGKKSKARTKVAKVSSPVQSKASQKTSSPEDEPWPEPLRQVIPHNAWKIYDHDHLAHTRPPNAPHPSPYRVSCPDAELEWEGESVPEFYLAFSATEEEWWSRFKWGAFDGILILQRQPKRVNKAVGVPFKWRAHYAHGHEDGDGEGKIFFDSAYTIRGEFYHFFRERPCYFRGKTIQFARRSINGQAPQIPYQPPAGTPVLEQMRIEWGQMPIAMRAAPAKKPRPKKEKPAESPAHPNTTTNRISDDDLDIYLSGTYKIASDSIEDTFVIHSPLRLTLFTEATGIWWASFQWACFDGVIKIDPGPTYETIEQPHSLGWRIRNTETGTLTFGRDCTGDIHFEGDNRALAGTLYGVPGIGRVDFVGKRLAGPRRTGGLKNEWDWFVGEAYGRT